jgi:hypothetical protein
VVARPVRATQPSDTSAGAGKFRHRADLERTDSWARHRRQGNLSGAESSHHALFLPSLPLRSATKCLAFSAMPFRLVLRLDFFGSPCWAGAPSEKCVSPQNHHALPEWARPGMSLNLGKGITLTVTAQAAIAAVEFGRLYCTTSVIGVVFVNCPEEAETVTV